MYISELLAGASQNGFGAVLYGALCFFFLLLLFRSFSSSFTLFLILPLLFIL